MRSAACLAVVIVAALAAAVAAADVDQNWALSLRDRTASDAFFTATNPSAFPKLWQVNNQYPAEAGFTSTTGRTLNFNIPTATAQNLLSNHDFTIFSDPNVGGNSNGVILKLTPSSTAPVTGSWTPTQPGTYWWGCTRTGHTYMGGRIVVSGAAIVGSSSGAAETTSTGAGGAATSSGSGSNVPATRPTDQSVCDYYTAKLGLSASSAADEQTLIRNIVTRTVFGGQGNGVTVVGIAGVPALLPYFNGAKNTRYAGIPTADLPAGSGLVTPNFAVEGGAQTYLVNQLVAFFGAALQCTAQNFPPYVAPRSGTQEAIHRNMNITQSLFSSFNTQVVNTALSYGVPESDAGALLAILNTFGRQSGGSNMICRESDCECIPSYKPKSEAPNCDVPLDGAASAVQVSVVAMMAASVAAILAARV